MVVNIKSYWDFAPFVYEQVVPEYSNNNWPITLPRDWGGDPRYVHNNGFWFSGGYSCTPGNNYWNVNSYTAEAWLKFYDNIPNNGWIYTKATTGPARLL